LIAPTRVQFPHEIAVVDSFVQTTGMSDAAISNLRGGNLVHGGDTVRFHVTDIFLPTRDDLPKALTTMQELEGVVADFSDSGLQPRAFAVIDVIARQSVVVPVEKLEVLNCPGTHDAP
jgi:hypothetical protein